MPTEKLVSQSSQQLVTNPTITVPLPTLGDIIRQFAKLTNKNALLRQRISEYNEEGRKKDPHVHELSSEILKFREDIVELKNENEKLSQMVVVLQMENVELKQMVAALQQKQEEQEDKLSEMGARLSRLGDSAYVGEVGFVLERVIVNRVFKDSGLSDLELRQVKLSYFYNSNKRMIPRMQLERDESLEFEKVKEEMLNNHGLNFETVFQFIIELKKQRASAAHVDPTIAESLTLQELQKKIDNVSIGTHNKHFKILAEILQSYNGDNPLKQQ